MLRPLFLTSLFILSGCGNFLDNMRHATNVNLRDVKNISRDREYMATLDRRVQVIEKNQKQSCSEVKSNQRARDNSLNQGRDMAIYYAKDEAYELDANSILIHSIEQVGNYGHEVHFDILNCPS